MNANQLLDIIGESRSQYILEAQAHREPAKRVRVIPAKRILLIAAVITLLVALVGFAAIVFDLDSLILGGYTAENYLGEQVEMDVISLQGYTGSKNYLAAKEWQEYSQINNAVDDSYVPPRAYDAYLCTNEAMTKKVDELCEKYGLELLGPRTLHNSLWETCDAVGITGIFADDALYSVENATGYHYGDGSFKADVGVVLRNEDAPWKHPITFEFRSVQKSSFDGVFISIHSDRQYEQWSYTTESGTELLLVQSKDHAMMFCDKSDSFVTVNISNTQYGEEYMDKTDLEFFAEVLRFDFITDTTPVTAYEPVGTVYYSDYADYISDLLEAGAVVSYAVEQVDGMNDDELIIFEGDGTIREILTIRDGYVQTMAKGGSLYLCEYHALNPIMDVNDPNYVYVYRIIEQESDVGGAIQHYYTYIVEDGQGVIADVLMECADGTYARSDNGGAAEHNWQSVTQEEYSALMGQYERLTLDRKYIGEFFGEHIPDFTMLREAFLPIAGGEVPTDWDSVFAFLTGLGYECSLDEGNYSVADPMNPDSYLMGDLTTENGILEIADVRYRLTLGDAVREVRAVFQGGGAEFQLNGGFLRESWVCVADLGELQQFIEELGT